MYTEESPVIIPPRQRDFHPSFVIADQWMLHS